MECNAFKTDHYTIITNETNFISSMTFLSKYRTNLQSLISSLTETIEIMDEHYKCYESCSILTAEADELNERLISYEKILISESLKDYQLSTLQDDLQNISIQIESLKEKFQLQEFPAEVSATESNAAVETVIQPILRKIQALQMKLRQRKNKNRILKMQLENKCKDAISEYQNINSWIQRITSDMQNCELPKFKDYIQAPFRKRHDYWSIVAKCKHEIENYHSECNFKKENIKTKELISKIVISNERFKICCF